MSYLPEVNSTLQRSLSSRTTAVIVIETFCDTFISVVALLGNSTVLFILYKNRALRTIPNYFVAALAVSDVAFSILITPWSITVLVLGYWPFGFAACQFQGFMSIFLACFSLISLTITAVNRYFGIVRNNLHRKYFTASKTRWYIFVAFVLGVLAASPSLMAGYVYEFQPGKYFCYQHQVLWLTMYLMIIFVGIPTTVIVICYFKVFLAIRKHQNNLMKNYRKRNPGEGRITVEDIKVTKTLFGTVVGFLLCWMPVFCIELTDLIRGGSTLPRQLYVMFTMCGLSSSAINPIIYGVMNRTFRRAYKNLFLCRKARRKSIRPTSFAVEDSKKGSVVGKDSLDGISKSQSKIHQKCNPKIDELDGGENELKEWENETSN